MTSAKKSSPSKGKTSPEKADDSKIEDAVIIGDEASDGSAVAPPDDKKPETAATEDVTKETSESDEAVTDAPEVTLSEDDKAAEDSRNAQAVPDDTPVDELTGAEATETIPPEAEPPKAERSQADTAQMVHPVPVPAPAPVRKSTFLPLVLGGIIAGILGFMAAEFDVFGRNDATATTGLRDALNVQQERITALENAPPPDVESAPPVEVDLSPIENQLSEIETRIAALEQRPVMTPADDTGGEEAAAYAQDLAALQSSVETQRAEIQALLDNAKTVEEATAEASRNATAQAAIAKIVSAIDAGQPFAEPLNALQSLDLGAVAPALSENAAEGVVTLSLLQAQFPDAARSALSAARAAGAVEGEQGISSFLKRQLGARSVTPREGNDPDAVLSRAEAALQKGNLSDTLTELDALPEQAGSALADWRAAADARVSARAAADDLAQRLTAD